MLLRTRITLLLALALILLGSALFGLSTVQQHLARDRLGSVAIALQDTLWTTLVAAEAEDLGLIAATLGARLAIGAPELSRQNVNEVLTNSPDLLMGGITAQVLAPDGEVVATTAPLFRARPLADPVVIGAITGSGAIFQGLRQETPSRFVIAAMQALEVRGNPIGVLTVFSDAAKVLETFARDTGEAAYLLSPRGRLAAGTDAQLWAKAQLVLPRTGVDARFVDVEERSYFAAPLEVKDLAGGPGGTLVALRDVTDLVAENRGAERLGLLLIAVAGIVIIAVLYGLLRNILMPLEDSVTALEAVSKGDLSRPPSRGGSGEIGRIGEAIAVFRRNAQRLIEQDERIVRQRRRQERVIRRELERLAELLDPEGRAQILGDLAAVMPADQPSSGGGHDNAQLATLARLLERMSRRIADQHSRLTELIEELKAAIVTRARLAALEQELDIARELQHSFLPRPMAPTDRFEVFGLMQSAKEVGGDFFDHFLIAEDRLAIVVADVSGKGVPAALFMAITRTLIRATALSSPSPAQTVREVNAFLAADNEQMMFVTLFHGILDLRSGAFTYVNAGHNPPYHLREGSLTALPRARGPALAVVEDFAYSEDSLSLAPGEGLFLYTDGVTEAFDVDGEAFGEARLEAELAGRDTLGAHDLCQAVRDAVIRFETGAEQADDITCVALKVR